MDEYMRENKLEGVATTAVKAAPPEEEIIDPPPKAKSDSKRTK
jgi:hypothetical protein